MGPHSGQTSLATALDTALNQGTGDLAQLAAVLKASPYSAVYRGQSLDMGVLQQAVAAVQILPPDYYSYYPHSGQPSPPNIYLAQELAEIVGVSASSISASLDTALQQTAATAGYAAMTVEQRWNALQTALTAADSSLTAADSDLTAQVLEQARQQGRAQRYDQAISSRMSSGSGEGFSIAGYISINSSYKSSGDELLLRPALLAVELGISQTELEAVILSAYQTDSGNYRTPSNPSGLGSLVNALQSSVSVSGLDEVGLKGYIKLVHLLPTGVSSAQLASQLNGFYSGQYSYYHWLGSADQSRLLTAARQAQGSSSSGQSGFEQAQRNFLIRLQDSSSSSYNESQVFSLVREAVANQQLLSLGLAADVSLQRLAWELWRSQYPALSSSGSYYPHSGQTSLATALDTALNQGTGDLAQLAAVLKAKQKKRGTKGKNK